MAINTSSPLVTEDITCIRSNFTRNQQYRDIRCQLGLNTKDVLERTAVWIAPDINIPKNATITAATVTFTAALDSSVGPFGATITAVEKDGRWNLGTIAAGWRSTTSTAPAGKDIPFRVELYSAGGSELSTGTNTGTFGGDRYTLRGFASPERITRTAQVVTPTTNFTLDNIDVYIDRGVIEQGPPGGDCWLTIHIVDGSGVPTETILATSDTRPANDVPLSFLAVLFNFVFSGADQIAISSGTQVAVVLNADYALGAGGPIRQAYLVGNVPPIYTGGDGFVYGEGLGLDDQNYPNELNFRELVEFPTDASFTFPFPLLIGATVVVDVLGTIQEVVADAGYVSNDKMLFIVEHDPATTALGEKFISGTADGGTIAPLLTVDFTGGDAIDHIVGFVVNVGTMMMRR